MDFPTDALVEILLRLPPSARRRARLVCKLWREAVDERTTEMQSRAKPLLWNYRLAVAYVVDDVSPSSTESCSELWRSSKPYTYPHFEADLQLITTCNGLLCLCNNETGDVTLLNPATGETLSVPPLPCTGDKFFRRYGRRSWERAYSFGYHPTSGRYKVVHGPMQI
ncbi:hypothetical protein QYE76_006658 [Lolium multiflorum]|uniref:F-box domain-containing protein n=1 Tax=Lolium multiflorum TaxID=4521 RepID=A0AAD8W4A9_LOLMU|nr:hypothetical protein QYE76_006658 [Lolium multiflorum]